MQERIYSLGYSDHFAFCDDEERHVSFIQLLRDEAKAGEQKAAQNQISQRLKLDGNLILEGYFSDLYKFFVRKLAQFECAPKAVEEDQTKLQSLLEELIRVKTILCEVESTDSASL